MATEVTLTLGFGKKIIINTTARIIITGTIVKPFEFTLYCSRIVLAMASWEEKKNIKSAFLLILVSILTIVFLFFIGIPLVAKLTAYIADLRKFNKIDTKNDITPPAPPRFSNFPDFTNQKSINLNGSSEVGATIKLTVNDEEKQNITDKDGNFTFSIELNKDQNSLQAVAVDEAGNASIETQVYTITYDDTPPELNIIKPNDGDNIFGANQRQLTIQGTTDPQTKVTINDRFVTVESDGAFQYTITMGDGNNTFNVKSTDPAGNLTEKNLSVNFTP